MKEDYITLKFSLDNPIYFKLGDWAKIENDATGLFEMVDLYKPTYNESTGGYDYELRLDAYYWKWKNKIFKFSPEHGSNEAAWNLTADLATHMGVFLKNLKALGYRYKGQEFTFSIDDTVEKAAKLISYDKTNLIDALTKMAEVWECEWWVANNVIHFGRCEMGDAVNFEIGVNVEKMHRSDNSQRYATRIYAFGSTKNIPANYRPTAEQAVINGIVQKRLMLPVDTPYIDSYPGMSQEEAVEDVVIFEDIFPRRVGSVSSVTTKEYTDKIENADGSSTYKKWNAYRFKDTGVNFSKEYLIPGQELRMIFQSGSLNGMEFAVTFNPDKHPEKNNEAWNAEAQVYEIVRNEDYGRPLPDETLKPKVGDKYILLGFDTRFVSDTYMPAAEQELKERAKAYAEKRKDPSTCDCSMMSDNVMGNMYEVGQRVKLINPAYFENGAFSRIIGFEYNLDIPYDTPVYKVGETSEYSRIGALEEKVESLTYKGQVYENTGGGGVYLITSYDRTSASDRNVFSAKRALKEFLSRQGDDTAEGLITFLKGLTSEGKITSKDFIEALKGIHIGANGSGVEVLPDGTTQAVVDRLYVKVKAYFETLEIRKKTHVGGEQILSPAGMKCIRMEEHDGYYRCFFLARQDGIEIHNEFTPGTLAISKEDNINEGASSGATNRYYWRKVVAVGRDYIDLSKTHCDQDSDAPAAGDDIVGLGHDTDIARQGAIVLSSVSEKAPSITFYAGINSYSLIHKEIIELGYDKVTGKPYQRIYGDFYAGARDKSTYMEYTPEKGVVIRGIVNIGDGSTGASNLTDLPQEVEKIIPPVWDIYAVNVIEGAPVDVNTNQKLAELGDGAVDLRAKFVRNGQDVTEVMKRSTLRLYEFKRINPLGHDDNNLSDEDWYEANKGKDVYRLTPGDVMWACNLVAVFDEDILENEYKKLK
ncbi:hypothetical protein IX334_002594 [Bacteroides pyogenes]|nr:hypothetical protein [Bacteroides pyogenes]